MKKETGKNWKWIFAITLLAMAGLSFFVYKKYLVKPAFTGNEKSIAVLPFADIRADKTDEYFSDGLTEEIILHLNKITDLKVIPRGSIMGYKGSKKNIQQIAKELHVAAVLQGEIQKSENKTTIHARLTDINTGEIIWTGVYDREARDIFSIQSEVAKLIAGELNAEFTEEEKNKIAARPTQSLEAYDQYLKGRYFYFERTDESLRKAIGYFNNAIHLDPIFAKAYSGLADCYSAQGYISYELPSTAFLKAEAAAIKALQLDSTLSEPHTSLAYIKFYYYWDWAGAEKEFLTAIRLDPHYALAYDSYGYYLTAMERYPEARVVMDKAVQLDPLSAQMNTDMGFCLFYMRNYDQAIQFLKTALIINPKAPLAHIWLGRAYQEKKMYKEANMEYELTLAGFKDWPVAYAAIGYVYGISDQHAEAEKMLTRLEDISSSRYVTPYGVALVYASLNDKERTFELLNKAYDDRSNWLVWLKTDPRWVLINSDKRYQALITKIGLLKNDRPATRQQ